QGVPSVRPPMSTLASSCPAAWIHSTASDLARETQRMRGRGASTGPTTGVVGDRSMSRVLSFGVPALQRGRRPESSERACTLATWCAGWSSFNGADDRSRRRADPGNVGLLGRLAELQRGRRPESSESYTVGELARLPEALQRGR